MSIFTTLALFISVTQATAATPLVDRHQRLNAASGDVLYYGGPVISHVKTVIVYWGAGVNPGTQGQLMDFYASLVNSAYLDRLGEYGTSRPAVDGRPGTQQTIGRGSVLGSVTITPINTAKTLSQADIERELEAQILAGGLPRPDADTYYALHFPDGYSISISFGLSCSSWLADHEVYVSPSLGNIYYAMFPCDSGDSANFDTLTSAASHELAEAIVDPMSPLSGQPNAFPAGWIRGDGQEIADLCMNDGGTLVAGTQQYQVNGLWLNSEGACHGGQFPSP